MWFYSARVLPSSPHGGLKGKRLLAVLLGLVACVAPAQEAPPAAETNEAERADTLPEPITVEATMGEVEAVFDTPGDRTVLSLEETLQRALAHNLDLYLDRFEPEIARARIEIAEAVFDPRVSADAEIGGSQAADTRFDANPDDRNFQTVGGSVSKRFTPGTETTATVDLGRTHTEGFDADYASELGASIRQPLLRGAGSEINLAPIARARSGARETELRVREQVLDVLAETESRYWELASAIARLALFETDLRLAQELVEENQRRFELGDATRLEVLQAQAGLAERREDVILAQQAVDQAEDNLRAVIGSFDFIEAPSLAVAPLPASPPPLPPFRQAARQAAARDLGLRAQYEAIEQRLIDIELA
ncbi:MAG: TolC family protein, partial [Opitutales bacterium]